MKNKKNKLFVKKTFSMPEEIYKKLLKFAKAENRTASNMLAKIIEAARMQ